MFQQFKIVVEEHPDGYVAYPLNLKGMVVGEGDTYEEALTNVKSAITFHIETFGKEVLEDERPILEATGRRRPSCGRRPPGPNSIRRVLGATITLPPILQHTLAQGVSALI